MVGDRHAFVASGCPVWATPVYEATDIRTAPAQLPEQETTRLCVPVAGPTKYHPTGKAYGEVSDVSATPLYVTPE